MYYWSDVTDIVSQRHVVLFVFVLHTACTNKISGGDKHEIYERKIKLNVKAKQFVKDVDIYIEIDEITSVETVYKTCLFLKMIRPATSVTICLFLYIIIVIIIVVIIIIIT